MQGPPKNRTRKTGPQNLDEAMHELLKAKTRREADEYVRGMAEREPKTTRGADRRVASPRREFHGHAGDLLNRLSGREYAPHSGIEQPSRQREVVVDEIKIPSPDPAIEPPKFEPISEGGWSLSTNIVVQAGASIIAGITKLKSRFMRWVERRTSEAEGQPVLPFDEEEE